MTISGLIDRMDDWVNPIVVKELRQAVKSRVITSLLLLFLGIQLVIMGMVLALQGASSQGSNGAEIFLVLHAIMLGTCMVLIPAYAAVRMRNERSETNVDLLYISTLKPTSIIAGKLFSALVLAMLIFSCCAPFMTFTYLMRGLDMPTILVVFWIDLLAVIASTQIALFLSSMHAPSALKTVLMVLAAIYMVYMFAALVAMTAFLIQQGIPLALDSEFLAVMGVTTLGVVLGTGLLFCWSVGLISPPSANRALAGRIFLVSSVVLMGAACLGVTLYFSRGSLGRDLRIPVTFWMAVSVLLFCLQILISVNERESWGHRVARTIPRSGLLRLLAFLFYSGSAGGVLLSVVGIGLVLLGWTSFEHLAPSVYGETEVVFSVFTAIALYTYCYSMTAVLVRSYLFPSKIGTGVTWVVVLLVLGLGTTIPWFFALLTTSPGMYSNQFAWWMLPNPFGPLFELEVRGINHENVAIRFLFLAIWATLVTGGALPWAMQQFSRFHRPMPRVTLEPEVVEAIEEVEPITSVKAR